MFSWLYGVITRARNSLYEKNVFKSYSLGVLTVSIGNITVGGTGKTPLVALVAEVLAKKGEKVCILTRGYGRDNPKKRVLASDGEKILTDVGQAGDEPFELARKLTGEAVVVADANRVSAGSWALEKFGITAFILDDAFQHRKVRRDLDVVCIDATNPFGNGKTLPSGILREPLENLKRADAIVITRANLTKDISNLKSQISKYNRTCPIFVAKNKIYALVKLEDFSAQTQKSPSLTDYRQMTADKSLAFCALGNPNNFFEQLRQEKFELVSTQRFPDHHSYTQKDIEKLVAQAEQSGAKILLTTAKDAVKLKDLKFEVPCFVVESTMVFVGENDFRDWLLIQNSKIKNDFFADLDEIEKETFIAKPRTKLRADKLNGTIEIDSHTTLMGVPPLAWEYKLGNRSALEWILDQYKERKPQDATIAERFNTYKFEDYKEQVIDLLKRVCTVSVKTMEIVGQMPGE